MSEQNADEIKRSCEVCGQDMDSLELGGALDFSCQNPVCPNLDVEVVVYDRERWAMNVLEEKMGLWGDPPDIVEVSDGSD